MNIIPNFPPRKECPDLSFSVNMYDDDGDKYEDGILIHIGSNFIFKLEDIEEYDKLISQLQNMREEIVETISESK